MPPLPFDKNLDVELIKLVEANTILYDNKHERYLESDRRDVVWQKIGDTLNRPAALCKTRWINIRDNMRRKLREREKRPNLQLKKYHPSYKYKYEDELGFLIPFFKVCAQMEGQESNDESMELFNDDSEVEQVFLDNENYEITESKPDISNLIVVNRGREERTSSSSGYGDGSYANVSTSQTQERVDPINVFLDAVGSTLRNLNPYYLNQAKSKIFQVVQDCELQQIVNKGEHPPAT